MLCLGDPSPPRPLAHLSTCSRSSPGLCLILFCASTLSISAALSPLMETMTSPGRRSPAAAFPCSITSEEKGTRGQSHRDQSHRAAGQRLRAPRAPPWPRSPLSRASPSPKSTPNPPKSGPKSLLPTASFYPWPSQNGASPTVGYKGRGQTGPPTPPAPTHPVWGRRPFPQSANPRGGQTGSCSSRAAPLSTRPAPRPGGELLPWRR